MIIPDLCPLQVRDWGSQGAANDVLQEYLKANK